MNREWVTNHFQKELIFISQSRSSALISYIKDQPMILGTSKFGMATNVDFQLTDFPALTSSDRVLIKMQNKNDEGFLNTDLLDYRKLICTDFTTVRLIRLFIILWIDSKWTFLMIKPLNLFPNPLLSTQH